MIPWAVYLVQFAPTNLYRLGASTNLDREYATLADEVNRYRQAIAPEHEIIVVRQVAGRGELTRSQATSTLKTISMAFGSSWFETPSAQVIETIREMMSAISTDAHQAVRQVSSTFSPSIEIGDIRLSESLMEGFRGGRALILTRSETALLAVILRNPGIILNAADLAERSRIPIATVFGFISSLRRHLGPPEVIITVRGEGYVFRPEEPNA